MVLYEVTGYAANKELISVNIMVYLKSDISWKF